MLDIKIVKPCHKSNKQHNKTHNVKITKTTTESNSDYFASNKKVLIAFRLPKQQLDFFWLGFTVKVIWRLSSFTGEGRPHVLLCALFQVRAFPNLAGQIPYMKEFNVPGGIQTHSGEGQVILSQQLYPLGHG